MAFPATVTSYLQEKLREENLIWVQLSKNTFHHGEEGMVAVVAKSGMVAGWLSEAWRQG